MDLLAYRVGDAGFYLVTLLALTIVPVIALVAADYLAERFARRFPPPFVIRRVSKRH